MGLDLIFRQTFDALRLVLATGVGLASCQAMAQVQGVTDTEIVLGTHQDLSGPLASIGAPFRDGLILAVEEVNAAGGVNGRKIRLVVEDNGYDPKKAVLATQKMLAQDKVFALISTLGSATSTASMPLALDRGVPFLFAGSASESSFLPYHPLKFALSTPYAWQTRAGVKFAYETLGKRKFGILYQDDDSGQSVLRAVEEQLAVYGLKLVESASYKRGEIDYSAQIARLKAGNLDVLMLGANVRETAAAEIEAKKQGWPVDMIAPTGAASTATLKLGGAATEGLYVTAQWLNSAQEPTPEVLAIKARYRARFGHEPEDGISQTYASIMLFVEGANNAGRNLTPQTLAQGLEKVKNFQTAFEAPPISYAPNDHAPPRGAYILKAQGGKYVKAIGPINY